MSMFLLRCIIVATFAMLALVIDSPAAEDLIARRLDTAKGEYADSMQKCHESFRNSLETSQGSAQSRGDKESVDRIKSVLAEFEASHQIPSVAPAAVKTRASKAQDKLRKVFKTAIEDYTRSKNDEAAAAVDRELRIFFRPSDAVEFDRSYYKVFTEQLSWEDAFARCAAMHGHLVFVMSTEENDFVTRVAKDRDLAAAWIGATDKVKEGKWVWGDGKPIAYSKWHRWPDGKSEPNDFRGEDYARLSVSEGGEWVDTPNAADNEVGFVCEWD